MFHISHLLKQTSRTQDTQLRRRATVLHVLFAVTLVILVLCALAICAVYLSGYNKLVLHRLYAVLLAIAVIAGLYIALKRKFYFMAAAGLLGIYWLLATIMAMTWGIMLPISGLLFASLIVLSGIILGAAYSIVTLGTTCMVLFIVELATVRGVIHPNLYWQHQTPQLTDLVVFYFVFTLLGVCSWLFNRQTDRSLHRALRAEAALEREKQLLELKVEQRTRELQAAQIDQMQQMYRFTQLGQFSTSMLHDLGNHMTTLSLDIEGMSEHNKRQTGLQRRIRERISYVDNMVQWAYEHINGKVQAKTFVVANEINEITNILRYDARTAYVQLHDMPKNTPHLTLYGDPARFRQLIANLVTNAIDAYDASKDMAGRDVSITAKATPDGGVQISVRDHGRGIPRGTQKKVFDPFYSTKHHGLGIGLFIVKQVVEEYFDGSIELTSKRGNTNFTVVLHAAQRKD
jgi:signal transduction histidine kinase